MAKKKPAAKKEEPTGAVLYPEVEVTIAKGENAATVEQVKTLLGWEEVPTWDESCSAEVRQITGKNVRLLHNTRNRPITASWLLTLRQSHLTKGRQGGSKWKFNGDTMVVGKRGEVLSGQHRGISFLLAEIERTEGKNARRYSEDFPEPLRLETIIVYGIEEDDETFETLNQGKPASVAEILFRHELFGAFKPSDRKIVTRMADYAVRMMWKRTGAGSVAFAPYRTPAESIDFLLRHEKLMECVKHLWEENKEGNRIGKLLSPGYASALLYLMGSSTSDVDEYRNVQPRPSERVLSWDRWDKAAEFWVLLPTSDDFHEVRQALYGLRDPDTGADGHITEKMAVLAKAWAAFAENVTPRPEDLTLAYDTDEDGIKHLKEHPIFGGIDLGEVEKEESEDTEEAPPAQEEEPKEAPPAKKSKKKETPAEETEEQKQARREEQKEKLLEARKKSPPKPKKKPEEAKQEENAA